MVVVLALALVLYRAWASEPLFPRYSHTVVKNVVFPYGIDDHIGRRSYMEDRHCASGELAGNRTQSLYAVFDGHGGAHAAEFCRMNITRLVRAALETTASPEDALRTAFEEADREVRTMLTLRSLLPFLRRL